MANIFFQEDKIPKQMAINSATIKISEYVDCRYEVRFASDDGGTHMEVQVEVQDVGEPVHSEHPQFPIDEIFPKWGGWRVTILKVPVGYIDLITLAGDSSDDY
tara:strand:- start:1200 stop:1508 length:309 start_codon:yes stop_codon:yes gene_type:complete